MEISRNSIIDEGIIKCLDEMYQHSQPSITWKELNEQAKLDKENGIEGRHYWDEHYLGKEEYDEIFEKWAHAYRAINEWKDDVDVVLRYLTEGGIKDKWIERNNGEPGYRGYEDVAPIKEQIEKILNDEFASGEVSPFVKDAIRDKIVETVLNTITTCKEFYRFDRDNERFSYNVNMMGPCCNIKSVQKWHDEHNTGEIIRERFYNDETDEYEYI